MWKVWLSISGVQAMKPLKDVISANTLRQQKNRWKVVKMRGNV
jgi:hypothetical protein